MVLLSCLWTEVGMVWDELPGSVHPPDLNEQVCVAGLRI